MGKIKNVFTMAILHLINNLANFSSRLLPVFIIVLVLLKLSKVLIDLNWYAVLSIVLLEVILIIFSISFNAVFFKKHKDNKNESTENQNNANNENNESTEISLKENKLPILNVAVAFFTFLGIIFVILKLFKAVTWNWVWVLSPLWLSTALVILILIICIIVFIVSALSKKNKTDNIDNSSSEKQEEAENNNAENKVNNSEEKTDNEINNNEISDNNKTNEENNK